MFEIIDKIIVLLLIPLVPTLISYLKKQQETLKERQESLKRSSLRNEILTIVLSKNLKNEDKLDMTKDLLDEYEALNGNHYIHTLIEKLKNGEFDERASGIYKL